MYGLRNFSQIGSQYVDHSRMRAKLVLNLTENARRRIAQPVEKVVG